MLPRGRVRVLSTHLDDAVLSIGAGVAAAARRGADVDVVTVLSGDPAQTCPADGGFATAGEVARVRQAEDARACASVGARPVWLGFSDDANGPLPNDEAVAAAVAEALAGSDVVLMAGWPLVLEDHIWCTALALPLVAPGTPVGLFFEQPYAAWQVASREHGIRPGALFRAPRRIVSIGLDVPSGAWRRVPACPRDWLAKAAGVRAYRSQLRVLRRYVVPRMAAHQLLMGGERVSWWTATGAS